MENHSVEFKKASTEDMTAFAAITAEWIRQGVTFTINQSFSHLYVKLTGGF